MAYERQIWNDLDPRYVLSAERLLHLENGLAEEETRAVSKESIIQSSIGTEKSRAETAENKLKTELGTTAGGSAAEVKAEETRAKAAEKLAKEAGETASTAVATEKTRALAAEAATLVSAQSFSEGEFIQTRVEIGNEKTRAEGAEAANKAGYEGVKGEVTTEKARAEAAEATKIPLSQKGAVSGVASLDSGGKVPKAQLPPAEAISTHALVHESELEPLAKTLAENPATAIATVSDTKKSYIWNGSYTNTIGTDWAELAASPITSVNSKTGVVVLAAADVGADVSGAAATAQTAAEGAATSKVNTEKSRAEAAEVTKLTKSENLNDVPNKVTARTNLGLGSAATEPSSAFATPLSVTNAQTAAESAATGKVNTEKSRAEGAENERLVRSNNLSDLPSPLTARGNLQLGTIATHETTDFDPAKSAENAQKAAEGAAKSEVSGEALARANADGQLLPSNSEQLIPAWKPNTTYASEEQVMFAKIMYVANSPGHTSGPSFEPGKWTRVGPGIVGPGGSVTSVQGKSGAVTLGTEDLGTYTKLNPKQWDNAKLTYLTGEYVSYQNKVYQAPATVAKTSTFNPASWTLIGIKAPREYIWMQDFGVVSGHGVGDQAPAIQAALDRAGEVTNKVTGVVRGEPGYYELQSRTRRNYKNLPTPYNEVWASLHVPAKVNLHGEGQLYTQFICTAANTVIHQEEKEKGGGRAYIIALDEKSGAGKASRVLSELEINAEGGAFGPRELSTTKKVPVLVDGCLSQGAGTTYRCVIDGHLRSAIVMRNDHHTIKECDLGGWAKLVWPTFMGAAGNNVMDNLGMVSGFCAVYVEAGAVCGGCAFYKCHFGFSAGPCIYKNEVEKEGEGFAGSFWERCIVEEPGRGFIIDDTMKTIIKNMHIVKLSNPPGGAGVVGGRVRGDLTQPSDAVVKAGGMNEVFVDPGSVLFSNSGYEPGTGCGIRVAGDVSNCELGDITDGFNSARAQGLPFIRAEEVIGVTAELQDQGQTMKVRFRSVEGPENIQRYDVVRKVKNPNAIGNQTFIKKFDNPGGVSEGIALNSASPGEGETQFVAVATPSGGGNAPGAVVQGHTSHLGAGNPIPKPLTFTPKSAVTVDPTTTTLLTASAKGLPYSATFLILGTGVEGKYGKINADEKTLENISFFNFSESETLTTAEVTIPTPSSTEYSIPVEAVEEFGTKGKLKIVTNLGPEEIEYGGKKTSGGFELTKCKGGSAGAKILKESLVIQQEPIKLTSETKITINNWPPPAAGGKAKSLSIFDAGENLQAPITLHASAINNETIKAIYLSSLADFPKSGIASIHGVPFHYKYANPIPSSIVVAEGIQYAPLLQIEDATSFPKSTTNESVAIRITGTKRYAGMKGEFNVAFTWNHQRWETPYMYLAGENEQTVQAIQPNTLITSTVTGPLSGGVVKVTQIKGFPASSVSKPRAITLTHVAETTIAGTTGQEYIIPKKGTGSLNVPLTSAAGWETGGGSFKVAGVQIVYEKITSNTLEKCEAPTTGAVTVKQGENAIQTISSEATYTGINTSTNEFTGVTLGSTTVTVAGPLPKATIEVNSVETFSSEGTIKIGANVISYTKLKTVAPFGFEGCVGGTGTISIGDAVTQVNKYPANESTAVAAQKVVFEATPAPYTIKVTLPANEKGEALPTLELPAKGHLQFGNIEPKKAPVGTGVIAYNKLTQIGSELFLEECSGALENGEATTYKAPIWFGILVTPGEIQEAFEKAENLAKTEKFGTAIGSGKIKSEGANLPWSVATINFEGISPTLMRDFSTELRKSPSGPYGYPELGSGNHAYAEKPIIASIRAGERGGTYAGVQSVPPVTTSSTSITKGQSTIKVVSSFDFPKKGAIKVTSGGTTIKVTYTSNVTTIKKGETGSPQAIEFKGIPGKGENSITQNLTQPLTIEGYPELTDVNASFGSKAIKAGVVVSTEGGCAELKGTSGSTATIGGAGAKSKLLRALQIDTLLGWNSHGGVYKIPAGAFTFLDKNSVSQPNPVLYGLYTTTKETQPRTVFSGSNQPTINKLFTEFPANGWKPTDKITVTVPDNYWFPFSGKFKVKAQKEKTTEEEVINYKAKGTVGATLIKPYNFNYELTEVEVADPKNLPSSGFVAAGGKAEFHYYEIKGKKLMGVTEAEGGTVLPVETTLAADVNLAASNEVKLTSGAGFPTGPFALEGAATTTNGIAPMTGSNFSIKVASIAGFEKTEGVVRIKDGSGTKEISYKKLKESGENEFQECNVLSGGTASSLNNTAVEGLQQIRFALQSTELTYVKSTAGKLEGVKGSTAEFKKIPTTKTNETGTLTGKTSLGANTNPVTEGFDPNGGTIKVGTSELSYTKIKSVAPFLFEGLAIIAPGSGSITSGENITQVTKAFYTEVKVDAFFECSTAKQSTAFKLTGYQIKKGTQIFSEDITRKFLIGVDPDPLVYEGVRIPIPAGVELIDQCVYPVAGSSGFPAAPASILSTAENAQLPYEGFRTVGGESAEEFVEVEEEEAVGETAEEEGTEEAEEASENYSKSFFIVKENARFGEPKAGQVTFRAPSGVVGTVAGGTIMATDMLTFNTTVAGSPVIKAQSTAGFPSSGSLIIGSVTCTYSGLAEAYTTITKTQKLFNTTQSNNLEVISTTGFPSSGTFKIGLAEFTYGSIVNSKTFGGVLWTGGVSGESTEAMEGRPVHFTKNEFLGIANVGKAQTKIKRIPKEGDTKVLVESTTEGFKPSGVLGIEGSSVKITYTSKSEKQFEGCTTASSTVAAGPYTLSTTGKLVQLASVTGFQNAKGIVIMGGHEVEFNGVKESAPIGLENVKSATSTATINTGEAVIQPLIKGIAATIVTSEAEFKEGQPIGLTYGKQFAGELGVRPRYVGQYEGDIGLVAAAVPGDTANYPLTGAVSAEADESSIILIEL